MTRSFRPSPGFTFPDGKRFAFTIFDDTDVATLESIRPIYDLLTRLGFRTTKTVWPLTYKAESDFAGSSTLEDPAYAAYMRELAARGFEIAFHGATMESSPRADTIRALELFREVLGTYPRSFASHSHNRDNLYWGLSRFHDRAVRALYRVLSREQPDWFQGHVEGSPYFWGDLSLRHLEYVRSFTFSGVDVWRATPHALYRDARTKWVKTWFCSSDADNVEEFIDLLAPHRQTELEAAGGLCIVSTHLGKGFVVNGRVEPRVERALVELAARGGWYVPTATIHDFLSAQGCATELSSAQGRELEWRWFVDSIVRRFKKRRYVKTELDYLAAEKPTA